MTVSELIKILTEFPKDSKVVMYTKCGPDSIDRAFINGNGDIVLDSESETCMHIIDGNCIHEVK